jgi:hypothetical protein
MKNVSFDLGVYAVQISTYSHFHIQLKIWCSLLLRKLPYRELKLPWDLNFVFMYYINLYM